MKVPLAYFRIRLRRDTFLDKTKKSSYFPIRFVGAVNQTHLLLRVVRSKEDSSPISKSHEVIYRSCVAVVTRWLLFCVPVFLSSLSFLSFSFIFSSLLFISFSHCLSFLLILISLLSLFCLL